MRLRISVNKKELLGSGLLCMIGLAAVLQVSATSMSRISGIGTGVLPVATGALLLLAGICWLFESRLSPDEDESNIGPSKWRGCCGVASGTFALLILGKYGGMVPAIFASVFIVAMGDVAHTFRSALALSLAATVLGAAAISWGPNVPFVLFGWP